MNNQFDNGFNNQNGDDMFVQYGPDPQNDLNNPYNQQMGYNQMNQNMGMQQPMMQQQPMMDQQMGYNPYNQNNQYPNQYDPNGGMYNQPMVQKSGGGGGIIGIILVLIIIAGLVFFLLEYTGTTNVTGWFDNDKSEEKSSKKEDKEEKEDKEDKTKDKGDKTGEKEQPSGSGVKDYEAELAKTCTLTDSNGNYNSDYEEIAKKKVGQLTEDEISKIYSGNYDNDIAWKLAKGETICSDGICMYFEDNSAHTVHVYSCSTNEYASASWDEINGG